jgi:hypothetical protein
MLRRTAGLTAGLVLLSLTACIDSPFHPLAPPESGLVRNEAPVGSAIYRPFKFRQTLGSFDPGAPTCLVEVPGFGLFPFSRELPGWGTATHLGKHTSTIHTAECGWDEEHGLQGSGTFVSIAANGDELSGSWSGRFSFQADGSLAMDAEFVFTGGTGRFASADGWAHLVGSIDVGGGWSTAEGVIRY